MANLVVATNPTQQQPPSAPIDPVPENPANHPELYNQGYPRLAYFFSQCPRYLHLRRFSALAIRIQLNRQHELAVLEQKLLDLERLDASVNPEYLRDYAHLTTESREHPIGQTSEQSELYERIKVVQREHEDSLIRSILLAPGGWDDTSLKNIQRFLSQQEGCDLTLSGLDATIWGSIKNPSSHASDLIQIFPKVESSIVGRLLKNRFSKWIPRLPPWLQFVFGKPDQFLQFQLSAPAFENAALIVGNILTSLLVYGAVTLLYLSTGKTLRVVSVILIPVIITCCTFLFQNHQFVILIAAVCAVLVALLGNDSSGRMH